MNIYNESLLFELRSEAEGLMKQMIRKPSSAAGGAPPVQAC